MRRLINMTCGIYKIQNLVNGKIYIGQSIEIENRFQKHLNAKDEFYIHKAIRKYGKENFSFQIVEECEASQLDEKEKYWIEYYNSLAPSGYNMIPGGSNGAGLAKGESVEQYDFNGELIAVYPSANQASIATGIDHWSICACCRGEYKRAGNFIWKYSKTQKEITPLNQRTDFTVLQLDKKNDIIISEFKSITEASKATNIAKATICNVCNGKGKTAGGFRWKFKNSK